MPKHNTIMKKDNNYRMRKQFSLRKEQKFMILPQAT